MGQRKAHGTAAQHGATSVLETLPYDELPTGTRAPQDSTTVAAAAEGGRFTKGNKRSSLGGRARKGKPRMAERVALSPPGEELPIAKYHKAAKKLASETASALAMNVGGGHLDPHTGYLVMASARAAKWANYFSDLAERMPEGSVDQRETVKAALTADEKASSHLRNAHDYAAKMAAAREAAGNAWQPYASPSEPQMSQEEVTLLETRVLELKEKNR